jgi:hypothetical protein
MHEGKPGRAKITVPAGTARTDATGLQVKGLGPFAVKDEAKGEVEAIIATINVVDRDMDVILPQAINSGSLVTMSAYAHDTVSGMFGGGGALPVGKGQVFVEGDQAIFRGKLFIATQRGRETLEVLKEMGKDQSWSFGYRVINSKLPDESWRKRGARRILTHLDVFEVSPELVGAGVGTRTVAAKAATAPKLADDTKAELLQEIERFETRAAKLAAETKAAETKAELAREIKRFKRNELLMNCLKEPLGALAWDAAEEGARWLSHGGLKEEPAVVWFEDDGRALGYFRPSRSDEIFLSRSLKPVREVVEVAMHETAHWWAIWDPSEERAESDSKWLTNRYYLKRRWS